MAQEETAKMQALEKVTEAERAHRQAKEAEIAARKDLHAAIADALRAGVGPTALEKPSGYDRQHINRIRKEFKIPPRRKATVRAIRQEPADD